MLFFDIVTTLVLIIIALVVYKQKGHMMALCLLILFNYVTYWLIYLISPNDYYFWDSIRVALIIVIVPKLVTFAKNPNLYYIYAVVLLITIMLNIVTAIKDFYAITDYFYILLSLCELVLFSIGINKTLKAKTRIKSDTARNFGIRVVFNTAYNWVSRCIKT